MDCPSARRLTPRSGHSTRFVLNGRSNIYNIAETTSEP
jgi:hypothetical protein